MSEQENKAKGKKSTNISVKKLEGIKRRLEEVSLDLSILIDELSSTHIKDNDNTYRKKRSVKGTNPEIPPKITEILSKFEELEREKFKEYLLGFELATIKKIISENGYGLPKVTSKWKDKEKLVVYLINELEKMSKKGNSLR